MRGTVGNRLLYVRARGPTVDGLSGTNVMIALF
jgi:hypothetical protein